MGKRVMALLRENTDKSFFFAFGAGRPEAYVHLLTSVWSAADFIKPIDENDFSITNYLLFVLFQDSVLLLL